MKKTVIIGSLIFFVGCLMFAVTMFSLNWDFKKISNRPPYEEKTMDIENSNQNISIDCNNVEISVAKSSDDKLHFMYSQRDKEYYKVENESDIKFKKIYDYKWYDYIFCFDFNVEEPFTVLIPDNYSGKLDFKTSNAKVNIEDVSFSDIVAKTSNAEINIQNINVTKDFYIKTNNNKVNLKSVNCGGKMDVITSNGRIDINDVTALALNAKSSNNKIFVKNIKMNDDLILKTSNGEIKFNSITANKKIDFQTSNNDISGILSGKLMDYKVSSKTSNGKNSLPESAKDGDIDLSVVTSNGDIDVWFKD